LFKSSNAGSSWTAMNNGLVISPGSTTAADVRALSIIPSNPATGAAATIYAGGSNGAFKSVDGGVTWTSLSANFPSGTFPEISSLVLDPTTIASPTANTVYAGTLTGVFKSTNSGASWTSMS